MRNDSLGAVRQRADRRDGFAPSFTRHASSAPTPSRLPAAMAKKPRSARFSIPGSEVPSSSSASSRSSPPPFRSRRPIQRSRVPRVRWRTCSNGPGILVPARRAELAIVARRVLPVPCVDAVDGHQAVRPRQAPPLRSAPWSASGTAASRSNELPHDLLAEPGAASPALIAAPSSGSSVFPPGRAAQPWPARTPSPARCSYPVPRRTGTRPARSTTVILAFSARSIAAPPGPRAAPGRSRHRRAAAPAGPHRTQVRQPLRPEARSGRDPGGRLRGLLAGVASPARAGWTAKRQAWQTQHATKLPADGMGVDNPRPTWSFVSFLVPPRPVTPP